MPATTSHTRSGRIMVVFGTRPEAIKLAPVVKVLEGAAGLEPIVVATGQHREILDQVLDLFGIVPALNLQLLRPGQSLESLTARAVEGLTDAVRGQRPDMVVVQGDTTTTFAGALAAFYERVPVAHVEAGLRTGDINSPFPEEMNRRLTTQLSAIHLAPTPSARDHLLREGVDPERIYVTGNTVIDALQRTVAQPRPNGDAALERADRHDGPVLLVTAHRRESWGKPMRRVGKALARLAAEAPDLLIVFPVHPNPLVREAIQPAVADCPNVMLTDPLPYGELAWLMHAADLVLTDSGGIQEEAPSLGKPVLVMRETTERMEGVRAGTAMLVGTDDKLIVSEVLRLLRSAADYEVMARSVNPYGDGHASRRTVEAIAHFFGTGPRPADFLRQTT